MTLKSTNILGMFTLLVAFQTHGHSGSFFTKAPHDFKKWAEQEVKFMLKMNYVKFENICNKFWAIVITQE